MALWTHVYVPYCSGDLHAGLNENVVVSGVVEPQTFLGYQNIAKVVDYLKPLYPNVVDVALAGASAGGFGVLFNYEQVAKNFEKPVVGIIDSAPIIPEFAGIRTSCFQNTLKETFNLQLPAACPECADTSQGGLIHMYKYLAKQFPRPQGRFAFMSEEGDWVGATLYDIESKKCGGVGVNPFSYRSALIKLRDEHIGYDWATFLPPGIIHTMTQSDELFLNRKIQQSSASQWLGRINEGTPVHIPQANLLPPPGTTPPPPPPQWCFSGSNLVEVLGRGKVSMMDLQIGDYVESSPAGQFSRVYSLLHIDVDAEATYLQIYIAGFDNPLEISEEHLLFVNGKPVRAKHVKIGDILLRQSQVQAIMSVKRRGVYAPATESGEIMVSGVHVSSYVAWMDIDPSLMILVSHAALSPLRIACALDFGFCERETYTNGLSDRVLGWVKLTENIKNYSPAVQLSVVIAAAPVVACAFALELILLPHIVVGGLGLLFLFGRKTSLYVRHK